MSLLLFAGTATFGAMERRWRSLIGPNATPHGAISPPSPMRLYVWDIWTDEVVVVWRGEEEEREVN